MLYLSLYCEDDFVDKIKIDKIDSELNNILNNAENFPSPGNVPTIEHPMDSETGYFKAGSEVFVPSRDITNYNGQNSHEGYVTYSFQVAWDKNYSNHDTDKHWNLKIFKSIHFNNEKPKRKKYNISSFKNLNHLKGKTIRLELSKDDGEILVSREFTNKEIKIVKESMK